VDNGVDHGAVRRRQRRDGVAGQLPAIKGNAGWRLAPYPAYGVCGSDKHRGMAVLKPDFINLIDTQRIHIENAT
jgi:hypothetical protein